MYFMDKNYILMLTGVSRASTCKADVDIIAPKQILRHSFVSKSIFLMFVLTVEP